MYKKYPYLDDLKWLKRQLITLQKSMASLAAEISKETGVPKAVLAACIRFRVVTYFTKEEIKQMKQERRFHKNSKV